MGRFNLTVGATTVVPYVHGRQKSVKIRIFAQKIKIVKSLKIVVQRIQIINNRDYSPKTNNNNNNVRLLHLRHKHNAQSTEATSATQG